jgi:hypothetical protein
VVGKAGRFDQKNEMFRRPLWDPEMLALGKKLYITEVAPKNKPTGRLHDSVRWGIKNLSFLNPLFLWGDDLLGYGKRGKADNFWMG